MLIVATKTQIKRKDGGVVVGGFGRRMSEFELKFDGKEGKERLW